MDHSSQGHSRTPKKKEKEGVSSEEPPKLGSKEVEGVRPQLEDLESNPNLAAAMRKKMQQGETDSNTVQSTASETYDLS